METRLKYQIFEYSEQTAALIVVSIIHIIRPRLADVGRKQFSLYLDDIKQAYFSSSWDLTTLYSAQKEPSNDVRIMTIQQLPQIWQIKTFLLPLIFGQTFKITQPIQFAACMHVKCERLACSTKVSFNSFRVQRMNLLRSNLLIYSHLCSQIRNDNKLLQDIFRQNVRKSCLLDIIRRNIDMIGS